MRPIKNAHKSLLMVLSALFVAFIPHSVATAQSGHTKTVTLTSYSTEQWYQSASDTNFPVTKTVTYQDPQTGKTWTFSIPKHGPPKPIASEEQTLTSISDGANAHYDPVDHTRLGYMSNNTTTYWGGAYNYSNPPRRPDTYYGPDPDKTGWTLVDIHWADGEPQPASDYPWLTKTPLGYYWVSDGTDGQPVEYNTYRKGVWLKYKKTVKTYEWQQEYQETVQIPVNQNPPPPPTQQCSPPSVPPMPLNQVLSYNWSGDGSGGQILTWTDTHWVLIQGVDSNGCVTYSWVDEPITYRHDYPLNLSDFQVTGLFYDPGTPWSLWSPSNPTASQENPDSGQDGSTNWGGPALPTFGNPARSPAVYVRVGGGVAFRLKWTGSPHDMPMSAEVTFRLSNPDGEANLWTQTFGLLPSTVDNRGDVPVWDPTGNGYPPPATEFGYAYTSIPKYAVTGTPTSFTQLTAWNLNGDSASAAHLSTSVSFTTTSGSTVTWTNPDLAQTLGYPTWYFLHQIPDAAASYEQPQPTGNRSYTTSSLTQIRPNGRLVPTMMAPGP